MFAPVLVSLRPRQWIKNSIIFAALLFGGKYAAAGPWAWTLLTFALFCLISSGCYLINDVVDAEKDRLHPIKRLRPVASGLLPKDVAVGLGFSFTFLGVVGGFGINLPTGLAGFAYAGLSLAYTGWLKKVVLLDVLTIAAGFVLRAMAGALAIQVKISPWLIVCTVQLALFMALAKRRCEILNLGAGAGNHRPVLDAYSPALLDQLIAVVTSTTVIAYSLYTISDRTHLVLRTQYLPLTIPFVVYGVFRYLYLIHRESGHGQPEVLLLTDRPLLLSVALWGLTCWIIIALAR